MPFIFQKYLLKKNYVVLYFIAHAILFVSELINLLLASRYNLKLGIPDIVLYLIGGSIATRVEMGLMMFPFVLILSKIFPVGIEATMWSFTFSVMVIMAAIVTPMVGVFINNTFF